MAEQDLQISPRTYRSRNSPQAQHNPNADKISALEECRIVEVGDQRELMERGGLYGQLYQRQVERAG